MFMRERGRLRGGDERKVDVRGRVKISLSDSTFIHQIRPSDRNRSHERRNTPQSCLTIFSFRRHNNISAISSSHPVVTSTIRRNLTMDGNALLRNITSMLQQSEPEIKKIHVKDVERDKAALVEHCAPGKFLIKTFDKKKPPEAANESLVPSSGSEDISEEKDNGPIPEHPEEEEDNTETSDHSEEEQDDWLEDADPLKLDPREIAEWSVSVDGEVMDIWDYLGDDWTAIIVCQLINSFY